MTLTIAALIIASLSIASFTILIAIAMVTKDDR